MAGKGNSYIYASPVAATVPYDNSNCDLDAETTQDALDELCGLVGSGVSPGFNWGKSGTTNAGTYLLNDTVPSNIAGRIIPITSGFITNISAVVEDATTCTFEVQRRVGVVFTTIASITLTAVRKSSGVIAVPPAVAIDDELCVKLASGSCKNPVVSIVIKGFI